MYVYFLLYLYVYLLTQYNDVGIILINVEVNVIIINDLMKMSMGLLMMEKMGNLLTFCFDLLWFLIYFFIVFFIKY